MKIPESGWNWQEIP